MSKTPLMAAASLIVALAVGSTSSDSIARQPAKDNEKANLIVNGSFEAGPDVGAEGYLPLDEDSVEIRGWVTIRGQIDLLQETDGN